VVVPDEFPMLTLPVPDVLILTVGETSETVPAAVLPIVVVPLPVVFNPNVASRIGLGRGIPFTVPVNVVVPVAFPMLVFPEPMLLMLIDVGA
jgi:hypothetical protein